MLSEVEMQKQQGQVVCAGLHSTCPLERTIYQKQSTAQVS